MKNFFSTVLSELPLFVVGCSDEVALSNGNHLVNVIFPHLPLAGYAIPVEGFVVGLFLSLLVWLVVGHYLSAFDNPDGVVNTFVQENSDVIPLAESGVNVCDKELCSRMKNDSARTHVPIATQIKTYDNPDSFPPLGSDVKNYSAKGKIVAKVDKWIEENLPNGIYAVGILCKAIGMSPTKLRMEMRKNTGMSPQQYIFAYRMKKAKELLALGKMTITEIAYELAFYDGKYFSKQFKRYYHQSPSDYVKSLKG